MSGDAFQGLKAEDHFKVEAVREHYDQLSFFYRALWGEHIHHGYWENSDTPSLAQEKLVERLAALACIKPGSRVLDVGCGLGGSALWLARHLDCSVLGLNISPVQVSMATEKARVEGLDGRAEFRVFDANHLDLPTESFDVVWVIECSEHITDKAQFISDCARILKKGGTLALCAWLKSESLSSPGGERLVSDVCQGMLCPGLATMRDYTQWMRASGLQQLEASDITRHVKETWARCEEVVRRQEIKALIGAADERTRRFVDTFSLMREAFESGAMAYGMFAAVKV